MLKFIFKSVTPNIVRVVSLENFLRNSCEPLVAISSRWLDKNLRFHARKSIQLLFCCCGSFKRHQWTAFNWISRMKRGGFNRTYWLEFSNCCDTSIITSSFIIFYSLISSEYLLVFPYLLWERQGVNELALNSLSLGIKVGMSKGRTRVGLNKEEIWLSRSRT